MIEFVIGSIASVLISEFSKKPKLAKGGSVLLAPNGKPSNLTPEQYKLVRTKEFKDWFGDWENNPSEASKVVDKNGEPLVVYHGSPKNDINKFKPNFDGIFFTDNLKVASSISGSKLLTTNKLTKEEKNILNKEYDDIYDYNNLFDDLRKIGYKIKIERENTADKYEDSRYENVATITNLNGETGKYPLTYFRIDLNIKGIIQRGRNYQVFLNIRNPLKVNAKNKEWDNINYKDKIITTADIIELTQENKNDGSIIKDLYEYYIKSDVFIVFKPTQIKLADGTNTTFDGNNPDIRFKKGGLFDRDTMAGGHQYTVFFDLNGRRTSRKVFANTSSSAESWIKFQYPQARNISSRKEY